MAFLSHGQAVVGGKLRIQLPECAWARRIEAIDETAKGGYAFKGRYVDTDKTYPLGMLILAVQGAYPDDLGVLLLVGTRALHSCEPWTKYWRSRLRQPAALLLAQEPIARTRGVVTDDLATVADIDCALRDLLLTELADLDELELAANAAVDSIDHAAHAIVVAGYRTLVKQHHPDVGGTNEAMQFLSAAKTQLLEVLKLIGEQK